MIYSENQEVGLISVIDPSGFQIAGSEEMKRKCGSIKKVADFGKLLAAQLELKFTGIQASTEKQ